VDAAVARGLRPAGEVELVQDFVHDARDGLGVGERRAGLRVDIDAELVRVIHVRAPRRPGMEVDRAETRGPGHVRDLGHAELVRVPAGRKSDPRDLDPVGPLLGHPLLVDGLALGAAGMALELRRTLVQRAHDSLADGDVVLDVVELRLAALGEVDLVGVRHLDGATADFQLDEG
jgi:hypothetical protein